MSLEIRTGLTTSYRTGDDGFHESGLDFDYTNNGNGTITDNITGLMWISDPINNVGEPFDATMPFTTALMNTSALSYAGHSDWRVPNFHELTTLLRFGGSTPFISDPTLFHVEGSTSYWTSTSHIHDDTRAWVIRFDRMSISHMGKSSQYWVRPVRTA